MKYFHGFLVFLFILFAYFQLNDPDAILWTSIYGYVALVTGLTFTGVKLKWLVVTGIFGYSVGILFYAPDFINWINSGMPSITGQMKAESDFIEVVREFLGLLFCLLTVIYLYMYDRSRLRKIKG
jgi:hypothetical protein